MAFGGDNAESYYDEGLTSMMKGDVARAADFFQRALGLDRSLTAASHQLGKCHLRMGDAARAVEVLGQVASRNPGLIPARLDHGLALLAAGKNAEARRQFMEILGIQPAHARAQLGLAQVSFQEGKWDNAMALAQTLRAQGGANFGASLLLGRAAKMAGRREAAQDALKTAGALIDKSIESSPNAPEGYYLKGEILFVLDRFLDAEEQYRDAEGRADPKKYYTAFGENFTRVDIVLKRAQCFQQIGEVARARELGRQAYAQAPDSALAKALKDL